MKKIIVILCVIGLMLVPSTMSMNNSKKTILSQNSEPEYTILITEFDFDIRTNVTEVDYDKNIIWQFGGLYCPHDAERLPNGNTLITVYGDEIVIEVDRAGDIVWQYETGTGSLPMDAERLDNGNTLIAQWGNKKVIEVNSTGTIVWQKDGLHKPMDAERLPNGNTLIAEGEIYDYGRVLEVDSEGNEVWNISELGGPVDIERLYNESLGYTTLVTTHTRNQGGNVTEYNESGDIIWQKTGLNHPSDAERLPNGNTLIAECAANRVIEINPEGQNVWLKSGLQYPVDVEILYNQPPDKPSLIAPEDESTIDSPHSATLEVQVTDPNYNSMDVHFYDASDNLIGTVTDVASGDTASIQWTDLSPETTYHWYAVADDSEFENKSNTWSFTTGILPPPSVKIEITNPKEGYFHIRDKPLFPFINKTVVYGPTNIKVNITSTSGVEKVAFYINDKLEETIDGEHNSYEYKWAPIKCGRYTIKTIVYDTEEQNALDSIVLFKWRAHPILIFTSFVLLFGILAQR